MRDDFVAKILVVRTCAIGDFILNLPALKALQERYPAASLTLVGNAPILDIANLFLRPNAIQSLESAPWRRLFYEPLDGLDYDLAIVWMSDPVVARNLVKSGIKDVRSLQPFSSDTHVAEHLLQTLDLPAPELPDLWAVIDRPYNSEFPLVLNPTVGALYERPLLLLHPGSGSPRKCWPYFQQLAECLESPAFLIGPAEKGFDTGPYRRYEGLPLREVAGVIAGSAGFIGNDSGITHLAGYIGCPTVALFGPTDPRVWGPIGRRVRVLWKPELSEISVADVLEASRSNRDDFQRRPG